MAVMKCSDIRNLLWDLIDGGLERRTQAEVEAHLAGCEACRRERELRGRVWDVLLLDEVPQHPDLTQRILNRATVRRRPVLRSRWVRWSAVAAAAACLVLGVALFLRQQPRTDDVPRDGTPIVQVTEPYTPYLEEQLVHIDAVSDLELLLYADFLEDLNGEPLAGGT